MNKTVQTLLVATAALTGCGGSLSTGSLVICQAGELAEINEEVGGDKGLDISGTVTAIDSDAVECSHSITVEAADGESWTVGVTVTDDKGEDVQLDIDLDLNETVELVYRSRLVWGEVAGFAVSDADGLVLAVEEGTWGGALEEGLIEGFSTSRSSEVLATETEECMVRESYAMDFEGDESLRLEPFEMAYDFQVNDASMWVLGVASVVPGPGRRCSVSDTTDVHSWVLNRMIFYP